MSDPFKTHLKTLYKEKTAQSFAEALFSHDLTEIIFKPLPRIQKPETKAEFSEKQHVLESLERFALDKVEEHKTKKISFPGGEINVKPIPGHELHKSYSSLFQQNELPPFTKSWTAMKKSVDILFVTEEIQTAKESEVKSEFEWYFAPETAQMFERMVKAMKIPVNDILMMGMKSQEASWMDFIWAYIHEYSPKLVVPLGASATQALLMGKERLAQVHGQFFERKINQKIFKTFPLFHPAIIETNPNMKKTTWADMQKIMQFLGKI